VALAPVVPAGFAVATVGFAVGAAGFAVAFSVLVTPVAVRTSALGLPAAAVPVRPAPTDVLAVPVPAPAAVTGPWATRVFVLAVGEGVRRRGSRDGGGGHAGGVVRPSLCGDHPSASAAAALTSRCERAGLPSALAVAGNFAAPAGTGTSALIDSFVHDTPCRFFAL
jgi:hypothetical protein